MVAYSIQSKKQGVESDQIQRAEWKMPLHQRRGNLFGEEKGTPNLQVDGGQKDYVAMLWDWKGSPDLIQPEPANEFVHNSW